MQYEIITDEASNIDWDKIPKEVLKPNSGKVIIVSTPKQNLHSDLVYFSVHRYLYRYDSLRKKLKKMAKNNEIKFSGYHKNNKSFYYLMTKEQHKLLIKTYIARTN